MNKKETLLAVGILDACIDTAFCPEVMLALDDLRRTLLDLWQRGQCRNMDAQALLGELEPLPALCREAEMHPTLPLRLCQVMFILCAPRLEAGRVLAPQCREQAWKIRRFRQWTRRLASLLVQDDAKLREEVLAFQASRLEMLDEAFAHFLALYRGSIAEAAAQRRGARQREIQRHWEALPLADVSDAATVSRIRMEGAKEKLSELAAEISPAEVFMKVKEAPMGRAQTLCGEELAGKAPLEET